MAKAVLVMDMPESCMECNFLYIDGDTMLDSCQALEVARTVDSETYEKPDWCPLRELPEKKETTYPQACYENSYWTDEMKAGFNTCLNEMVGGKS